MAYSNGKSRGCFGLTIMAANVFGWMAIIKWVTAAMWALCIASLLCAANWLLSRIVYTFVVLLILATGGCTYALPTPPPWECHKAIRYAVYSRHACVIYEATTIHCCGHFQHWKGVL
jgi:hypothetical protein